MYSFGASRDYANAVRHCERVTAPLKTGMIAEMRMSSGIEAYANLHNFNMPQS